MYAIDQPQTRVTAELENSILKVLAWFDLFHYPLPAGEVTFFLDRVASPEDLRQALQQLVNNQLIFLHEGYYSLENKTELVNRRLKGNERARHLLKTAHRVGRLLYHFPYVRGICISGSLSKNYADEKADIDLFIITHGNRLWVARTAMHLFKKLTYLCGRQHWFCMNYYIDEDALQIREQNIFTAIELITLMPVCGDKAIGRLFSENAWASHYLPGYSSKPLLNNASGKKYRIKDWLERVFNNRMGDRLDEYLMQLTTRRWKQKEEHHKVNMKGGRMGLDTGKHFSKPNPAFFQQSILERYQQRLEVLLAKREQLSRVGYELQPTGSGAQ